MIYGIQSISLGACSDTLGRSKTEPISIVLRCQSTDRTKILLIGILPFAHLKMRRTRHSDYSVYPRPHISRCGVCNRTASLSVSMSDRTHSTVGSPDSVLYVLGLDHPKVLEPILRCQSTRLRPKGVGLGFDPLSMWSARRLTGQCSLRTRI